jgi:hypothetical protein
MVRQVVFRCWDASVEMVVVEDLCCFFVLRPVPTWRGGISHFCGGWAFSWVGEGGRGRERAMYYAAHVLFHGSITYASQSDLTK